MEKLAQASLFFKALGSRKPSRHWKRLIDTTNAFGNSELSEEEISSLTLQTYLRACEFINKEMVIAISSMLACAK